MPETYSQMILKNNNMYIQRQSKCVKLLTAGGTQQRILRILCTILSTCL